MTSTSTVGLPRESSTSRANTLLIFTASPRLLDPRSVNLGLPSHGSSSRMARIFGKTMALLPSPPAKYKGRLAACVVALVLFVVAAVCGDHGLVHVLRMRGEQSDLE